MRICSPDVVKLHSHNQDKKSLFMRDLYSLRGNNIMTYKVIMPLLAKPWKRVKLSPGLNKLAIGAKEKFSWKSNRIRRH